MHRPEPAAPISDLFSFEEMTTLADEARILSLLVPGNSTLNAQLVAPLPPEGLWLDVARERASPFHILAAHPRLLEPARRFAGADVTSASLKIWVPNGGAATPASDVTIVAPAQGQVSVVICLSGFAKTSIAGAATMGAGSVLWVTGDAPETLRAEGACMICVVAYEVALARDHALRPVADDSLWPPAYVMAG